MIIRSFEPRDLPRLTELTIETFGPFYEDSFRPLVGEVVFTRQHGQWREDYHTLLTTLHTPEHNKHAAVADLDGQIAGYVGWEIDPAREHGTIGILAVDARHRRDHLATELCEHAFGHMRAHGAVYAEIGTGGDEFHAPARALYESLGCIKLPVAVYFREL
ncbi:GNAT family N-acetyltransferase [Kitasatospora sp. NPDC091335]|uniref:GNAT family N-acetyltransferase n=1 Tax=Kitasatospora sp. NPDC091335 TaxID=3364085 RepID=UPI0037F4A4E4